MKANAQYDYFEFKQVMAEQEGNISRVAKHYGVSRQTIYAWVERMKADDALIKKATNSDKYGEYEVKYLLDIIVYMEEGETDDAEGHCSDIGLSEEYKAARIKAVKEIEDHHEYLYELAVEGGYRLDDELIFDAIAKAGSEPKLAKAIGVARKRVRWLDSRLYVEDTKEDREIVTKIKEYLKK